jgi:hypothetical protein
MSIFQKDSKAMKGLLIVLVVGLLGFAGWYVYDQNKSTSSSETTNTATETDTTEIDLGYEIFEGMKYTIPENWKNKDSRENDAVEGLGQYLFSPDYKIASASQVTLEAGASIYFGKLSFEGITSDTTLEEASEIVKKDENGFADPDSVKITTVLDKQVLMFNSGKTAEDESAYYKAPSGQWYGLYFNSAPKAEDSSEPNSPYYATFLTWLKDFILLNP